MRIEFVSRHIDVPRSRNRATAKSFRLGQGRKAYLDFISSVWRAVVFRPHMCFKLDIAIRAVWGYLTRSSSTAHHKSGYGLRSLQPQSNVRTGATISLLPPAHFLRSPQNEARVVYVSLKIFKSTSIDAPLPSTILRFPTRSLPYITRRHTPFACDHLPALLFLKTCRRAFQEPRQLGSNKADVEGARRSWRVQPMWKKWEAVALRSKDGEG